MKQLGNWIVLLGAGLSLFPSGLNGGEAGDRTTVSSSSGQVGAKPPSFYINSGWRRFLGRHHFQEALGPFPPANDPSAYGPLSYDPLPEGLPHANGGAFEGGLTGTAADALANNSISEAEQEDNGTFDVPTNGSPSPLFGAEAFSQRMLRFEEFGTQSLELRGRRPRHWEALPRPASAQDIPEGEALEGFLAQDIWPKPTAFANTKERNPWKSEIESHLGRNLKRPPA